MMLDRVMAVIAAAGLVITLWKFAEARADAEPLALRRAYVLQGLLWLVILLGAVREVAGG